MPQVGNKKFPYTPAGIKQAANARRQKIAGAMDKVYRPDRDGPKRVAQTLPRPVGTRLPRPKPGRKPRPGRGALAPRPWRPGRPGRGPLGVGRPKPPNRRYL